MLVAAGHRAAAVFNRSNMVLSHFGGADGLPFGLDYLTDLFLDRHSLEQRVDALFNFRVEANRRLALRP
jgi:hypothetical protein